MARQRLGITPARAARVPRLLRCLTGVWLGLMAAAAIAGTAAVNISLTITPNPIVAGSPTKFTVSVTSASGSGTPTGTVDIFAGAKQCTITLPGTNCSLTLSGSGSVTVTAVYNGDANFAGNGISKTTSVVPPTTTTLTSARNPSNQGQNVSFTASVNGAAPTGTVAFKDGGSALCNNVALAAAKAVCSTTALSVGSHSITATYSGDAANGTSTSAPLTQVVVASSVYLDQFGLTGTWYNAATSGQGVLLVSYPDLAAAGVSVLAGGWFTYDVAPAGGADKQRWYTFSGNANATDPVAQLDLFTTVGGNFNAGPKVSATKIGQVALQFSDCGTGSFAYAFSDGSGRSGVIPITRLTANVTCGSARDNGNPGGNYLLSGAWYDPNTSGQGLLVEVNPVGNYFAAAWYTFSPNGQASGGAASQRWYTLQAAPLPTGSNAIADIAVLTRTGGIFDNNAVAPQTQVGTATMAFQTCTTATLTFSFSGGSSAGQAGTIALQRVGPAPAGCSL